MNIWILIIGGLAMLITGLLLPGTVANFRHGSLSTIWEFVLVYLCLAVSLIIAFCLSTAVGLIVSALYLFEILTGWFEIKNYYGG